MFPEVRQVLKNYCMLSLNVVQVAVTRKRVLSWSLRRQRNTVGSQATPEGRGRNLRSHVTCSIKSYLFWMWCKSPRSIWVEKQIHKPLMQGSTVSGKLLPNQNSPVKHAIDPLIHFFKSTLTTVFMWESSPGSPLCDPALYPDFHLKVAFVALSTMLFLYFRHYHPLLSRMYHACAFQGL